MHAKYYHPVPLTQAPFFQLENIVMNQDTGEQFRLLKIKGKGTFGAVYEALDQSGNSVSVKKVLLDPRFKNREVEILKKMNHPNCLKLFSYFLQREVNERQQSQIFLYIVTNILPLDLSHYMKLNSVPPLSLIKVFSFQIFRALAYLHSIGICHRDIKPSNVLVDPDKGRLQLCDFGSAKPIQSNEASVPYIATRSYRAPELLFECKHYGYPVDIWAAGCVIAEMLTGGHPIFSCTSNLEMINLIAEIIGSPTQAEMTSIHGTSTYIGQTIPPKSISSLFPDWAPKELVDLLSQILVYDPGKRPTAHDCMKHPYFDEIRSETVVMQNGLPFFLPMQSF